MSSERGCGGISPGLMLSAPITASRRRRQLETYHPAEAETLQLNISVSCEAAAQAVGVYIHSFAPDKILVKLDEKK